MEKKEIRGTYSPLFTKKRNINSEIAFQEYDCIVKKRICSVKRILKDQKIIGEMVNYYFIIEYYDNHSSIIKKVLLEEILFDTDDFLYIDEYTTINYINVVEKDKKLVFKDLSKENKHILLDKNNNKLSLINFNDKNNIGLNISPIVI